MYSSTNTTCNQELLILGFHNSGTSQVARLLMLAGVWAGKPEQLAIGRINKLKWCVSLMPSSFLNVVNIYIILNTVSRWEHHAVVRLNDLIIGNHTTKFWPVWTGVGFEPRMLSHTDLRAFNEEAGRIVQELGQYCEGAGKQAINPQALGCELAYCTPMCLGVTLLNRLWHT